MIAAMDDSTETVREQTVREMVNAGAVHSTAAVGREGGFAISVRYGNTERLLGSTRGKIKVFSNLTSVATCLKGLGIEVFEVQTAGYAPGRVRPPRPDRAEALRKTRTTPRQSDLLN